MFTVQDSVLEAHIGFGYQARQERAEHEDQLQRDEAYFEVRNTKSIWYYASTNNLNELLAERLVLNPNLDHLSKLLVAKDYVGIGKFIERHAIEYTTDCYPS